MGEIEEAFKYLFSFYETLIFHGGVEQSFS